MMLAMQQQQQNALLQKQAMAPVSNDSMSIASKATAMSKSAQGALNAATAQNLFKQFGGLDPLPYGARATSIGSISGLPNFSGLGDAASTFGMAKSFASAPKGATLPPHPKQKPLSQAPGPGSIPSTLNIPPTRLTSLGTLSNLSRNISNLSRGTSMESQSSALLNNAFEDKIFSMIVANESKAALNAQLNLDPTPLADTILLQAAMANKNAAAMNSAAMNSAASVATYGSTAAPATAKI